MEQHKSGETSLDPKTREFYRESITLLTESRIPFLLGGAYALDAYTGITRHTKDIDLFIHRRDLPRVVDAFAAAGYRTELTFPHWLAKAFQDSIFIDIIFSSGNGIAEVDEGWFEHGLEGEVFGLPVKLCPAEEMIWSKAFVMERERYDGADVMHILRARGGKLDWARLLERFGAHWRVLLSHLVLFGFAYPGERDAVPRRVLSELLKRLENEMNTPPPSGRICRGTLLSRGQYLIDLQQWGYQDGRLLPRGTMTEEQAARWTDAIEEEK